MSTIQLESTNIAQTLLKIASDENITFNPANIRPYIEWTEFKNRTVEINISNDAEWNSKVNSPNDYLTIQVSTREGTTLVLEHPQCGLGILPTWSGETPLPEILGMRQIEPTESVHRILVVNLLIYWSFGDIDSFWGNRLSRFIAYKCEQKRRISVIKKSPTDEDTILLDYYLSDDNYNYQVAVRPLDISAMVMNEGLSKVAAAVGVEMRSKELMDEFKTNMRLAYINYTPEYLKYSADDSRVLFQIKEKWKKLRLELYKIYGLNPASENPEMTTGTFVARLFQSWLENHIGQFNPVNLFSTFKATKNKNYKIDNLLKYAGVKYLAKCETTKQFGALVQGGRAKNEDPMNCIFDNLTGDADVTSMYGRILTQMTYCVGIPTIIHFDMGVTSQKKENKFLEKTTLQEFLRKWKDELISGCWFAVISGKLSFQQLLIPSKDIDEIDVYFGMDNYNEESTNIDAPFGIYTNEIKNGILNHDLLQICKAVMTPKEWSEFLNIQVVCAVIYPASLRYEDSKKWYDAIEQEKEKTGNCLDVKTNSAGKEKIEDHRSRKWLAIPINDFIHPLIERRKSAKEKIKKLEYLLVDQLVSNTKKEEIKLKIASLDAEQKSYKLVINTLYGVIASPYFPISNVVVGNNITARGRAIAWLMNTALGTKQTITDGGMYFLNYVNDWKVQRPSMNTITCMTRPHLLSRKAKKNLLKVPLGGKNWKFIRIEDSKTILRRGDFEIKGFKEHWQEIDELALNHIKNYFTNKDIDLLTKNLFSIEHKDIYKSAYTQSQTNYVFVTFEADKKIKARGHKIDAVTLNAEGIPIDPEEIAVKIFFNQLEKREHIKPALINIIAQPLKVNQWHKAINARESNAIRDRNLLPGTSISKQLCFRPISLSMFHYKTIAQRKSWENTNDKFKRKYGWGIEVYYLTSERQVDYEKAIREIQMAIDKDMDWIVPKSKSYLEDHSRHPYFPCTFVETQKDIQSVADIIDYQKMTWKELVNQAKVQDIKYASRKTKAELASLLTEKNKLAHFISVY